MNRLILCLLLLAAESVMGRSVPENGYSDDNGVIRVSIFIDLAKEKNIKFPEGTAMLRANRLLQKACPRLPAKYSVAGRVLTNSHNRVEKIYSYVVEYDSQSIDDAIKQSEADAEKAREAERIAAEKAVAEKKAVEHDARGLSVLLDDITVRDIEDKNVKPKVMEKNGFKKVDIDSFGGIDPME